MATIVTTGQISIVDNNDARPIASYITASNGKQQTYSKDESTIAWNPNWASVNNVLTARVYVGNVSGANESAALLTNRKWSNSIGGASLGSGTTLTVNTNLDPAVQTQKIYYFEGDYTDPVTGMVSHVIAQFDLSVVSTGTNAVYLLSRGTSAIEQATGATKNVAVIAVNLMRAAGADIIGTDYKFFEQNGTVQITTAMSTKYGLKTTAPEVLPSGAAANIGQNLPAANAWSPHNTLVINESAVADMAVIRAVAKDADGKEYQCSFVVYDVSDPYDLKIFSTGGDKLQNGVGSTNLTPLVSNGSRRLSDAELSAWEFKWFFYDGDITGNRAGFVDTVRTAVAGGRSITANTAGAGSVIGYSGAAIAFTAGDMVKIVKSNGQVRYYEVASGTTNANLTLRTATISTFLNVPWPTSAITASEFVGGKLFVCAGTGATAGTRTTIGATAFVTVTGDEIDGKGTIICEASRP